MSQAASPPRRTRRFVVPISWKLLGATAVVGAVAAVIAIIGLKRINTLNQNLQQTVVFLATKVTLASLARQDLLSILRAERNMILARSKDGANRFAAMTDEISAAMDHRLKQLRGLVDEDDQRRLDLFTDRWQAWQKNHESVRRFAGMNSDAQARTISAGEASDAIARMESTLRSMAESFQMELDEAANNSDQAGTVAAAGKLALVAAVSRAALEMQRAEKDLILAVTEGEVEQREDTIAPLEENLRAQISRLSEAAGASLSGELTDLRKALADYTAASTRIRLLAGEQSNFLAYHFVVEIGAPIAAECEALLDGLVRSNEREMQDHRRNSQQTYTEARNTLLGISIFGILVSVAFSFYTGHQVARRLSILSRFARTIQNTGDLSRPTPPLGNDEVGSLAESFDQMRQSLHEQSLSLGQHTARLSELTRRLETKNREMEQFVYTVSHDLKSPLVSCKGLLGLLKEDLAQCDYEAVLESAGRLDQATDQLNQIIEDLLMLSRLGRKSLELEQIDVGALVNELTEELSDRAAKAGARFEVADDMPAVVADRSDVRRVFENLLTNALKYGCSGARPAIEVGGKSADGEVSFFVRDHGPGIDPKYHQKVFGLFQRLDTDQPGTGLGLASVAKIMSMHGGRSWVESVPEQGATFWIAFPARTCRGTPG